MLALVILTVIFATCVSIFTVYKSDPHKKKDFAVTFIITIVGTFSGVFLAAEISDYQTKTREINDLKHLLNIAHVEAATSTFAVGEIQIGVLSSLGDGQPVSTSDIDKLKHKLADFKYNNSVKQLNSYKNSPHLDRMKIIDALYTSQIAFKYIPQSCRALSALLLFMDEDRIIIRSDKTSDIKRLEAITRYESKAGKVDKIIQLSYKSLTKGLTEAEKSEIHELSGYSQLGHMVNGKPIHVSPIEDLR